MATFFFIVLGWLRVAGGQLSGCNAPFSTTDNSTTCNQQNKTPQAIASGFANQNPT